MVDEDVAGDPTGVAWGPLEVTTEAKAGTMGVIPWTMGCQMVLNTMKVEAGGEGRDEAVAEEAVGVLLGKIMRVGQLVAITMARTTEGAVAVRGPMKVTPRLPRGIRGCIRSVQWFPYDLELEAGGSGGCWCQAA